MSKAEVFFWLAVTLGPILLTFGLLIFWQVRRVPQDDDQQSTFLAVSWAGLIYFAIAVFAFYIGGLWAALISIAAIVGLALLWALALTLFENAKHLLDRRRTSRARLPSPPSLSPTHCRFLDYAWWAVVGLPIHLVSHASP